MRDLPIAYGNSCYAIAALMTQIPGWKRGAAAKRLPLYGKQRIYEKG